MSSRRTSVVLVAATLGGGAAVGAAASIWVSVGLLAALAATAVTIATLRQPAVGVLLVLAAGMILPLGIQVGGSRITPTILLLPPVLALLALALIGKESGPRRWSGPEVILAGFCLSVCTSLLVGNLLVFPHPPAPLVAQMAQLSVFLLSVGAFVAVAWGVRSVVWLQRLTALFLVLGALYVVGRLGGWGAPVLRLYQEGTVGSLFWTWLVAVAAGQAVGNRSLSSTWRVSLLVLVLLTFWVGLGQSANWVSGWLPPAVALGAIICIARPLVGLPSILGVSLLAYWQRAWLIQDVVVENTYSLLTRIEAWKIVSQIVEASPLLGSGPANYYWYASVYPILGWYVPFSSHNQYLDLAAQTGLLGLALFLWFAWRMGRVTWKQARQGTFGFERGYALGAFGGLCGSLAAGALADWILPFVYNTGLRAVSSSALFWLFLGGVMTLERLTRAATETSYTERVQPEINAVRVGAAS